ncbi:MAG: hypothetical protein H7144_07990 [Burkholderiales bacterium]|nr:hypothetical protein [Phycisphaerae bacterium]
MDLVKKNLLSIICGVVAILCIVLIFFPFGGMYDTLRTSVEESKAVGESIKKVSEAPRMWPSLSSREEDRVQLNAFPTDATIIAAEKMTKDWTTRSTQFLEYAISLQKEKFRPLVPNALPSGGGVATGVEFIRLYQRRFGVWVNPQTQERPQDESIFTQILGAGIPPTPEEVKTEQDTRAAQIKQEQTIVVEGQEKNAPEVLKIINERIAKIAERMRNDRAFKLSIYADPLTSLDVNPKIAGNTAPSADDMFDAQVTLWIQEDMCRAIAETNKAENPKQGVLDSPVKRLTRLMVVHSYHPPLQVLGVAPTPVTPLPANANTKVAFNYTANPLGHVSNDFYDVLNFDMVLVCETERLPATIASLTRNRYAMFREVKVEAIDSSIDAAQGFLYGPKPVAQVTLRGQYLLLRQFISPFMPPNVIRSLTAPAPEAAPVG